MTNSLDGDTDGVGELTDGNHDVVDLSSTVPPRCGEYWFRHHLFNQNPGGIAKLKFHGIRDYLLIPTTPIHYPWNDRVRLRRNRRR